MSILVVLILCYKKTCTRTKIELRYHQDYVDISEESGSHIYEPIPDNIDQEDGHATEATVEGQIEPPTDSEDVCPDATGSEGVCPDGEDVCPDAAGSEGVCPDGEDVCPEYAAGSEDVCRDGEDVCPNAAGSEDLCPDAAGTDDVCPPEPATEEATHFGQPAAEVIADAAVNVISPATEEHNQTLAADPSDDTSLIATTPNQAYGCPIKKVDEGHTYTNVDLEEATTLFYTTSDGTRTYRPPGRAMEAAVEQITSDATVDGTPQAITQSEAEHCHTIWAAGFSENTCLDPTASPEDVGPEEAISRSSTDTGPKQAISLVDTNSEAEDECPIMTLSNEAYGCDIELEDMSHGYENVDLEEATTLFYTTSDGTRTYRPRRKQAPAVPSLL